MDVFSKSKRSEVMSKVRSKGNASTEMRLISYFKAHGVKGWRRGYAVKGKPDFVFLERKIAVFTDGCFWHGHDCRNTRPSANREFWEEKRRKNIERDRAVVARFEARGWTVIRVWECELKPKNAEILERKLKPLIQI